PGYAEREERPDEEHGAARVRNPAAHDADRPAEMEDGNARREKRQDEGDDVPPAPAGEHNCSQEPKDQNRDDVEARRPSFLEPAHDVVRYMEQHQEHRQQRSGDRQFLVFHPKLSWGLNGLKYGLKWTGAASVGALP